MAYTAGGTPYTVGSGCCGCGADTTCTCLAGGTAQWCGTPDTPGAGGFDDPPAQWWVAPVVGGFQGATANVRHLTGTDGLGTVWNGFEAWVYYLSFARTAGCTIGYIYNVAHVIVNCDPGDASCAAIRAAYLTALCGAGCIAVVFPDYDVAGGVPIGAFSTQYSGTATAPTAMCTGGTFQFFLPAFSGSVATGPPGLRASGVCLGVPTVGAPVVPMTVDVVPPYTFAAGPCTCLEDDPEDPGGGGEGLMARAPQHPEAVRLAAADPMLLPGCCG